jgi:hypothetical protein
LADLTPIWKKFRTISESLQDIRSSQPQAVISTRDQG